MGKTGKAIKRTIITGAMVGALVGSQTMNLFNTYQKALNAAKYATQAEITTYRKIFRKDPSLKNNTVLSEEYGTALKEDKEISNRLGRYKKASDVEKTGIIATDFKRYGLTAKSFKPAIPLSKEGAEKTGKGAIGGAGAGLTALGAWKIRKRRKRKKKEKEKMRKRLEEENQ